MILLRLPLAFLRLLIRSMFLALGQVWANKVRSILTTVGIVIGVASVTAVIAALTGLRANVLADFESLGVNKIYLFPRWPEEGPREEASWEKIRLRPEQFDGLLGHCPSVSRFTRMSQVGGMQVRHGERSANVRLIGMEPAWHKIENRFVKMGRPFSLIDEAAARQVCLITEAVRDKLRLDRNCIGQRIGLYGRSFTIVGVVEPATEFSLFGGGGQRDEEVFIPFRTIDKLFRAGMYAIATSQTPELSEEAQAEVRFFLRRKRNLKPGEPDTFGCEAVQKYLEQFTAMAAMITLVAGGIVGISLLVGGVGIMNIMLVSVSERTREIGLRKAVGARPSAILLQFLVEAVMLCLIGGLIGLLIGQLITTGLASIPQAKLDKAYIPVWAVGLSFGFSAFVGVVFGMFPAIKAARLDPIEALRHE